MVRGKEAGGRAGGRRLDPGGKASEAGPGAEAGQQEAGSRGGGQRDAWEGRVARAAG